MPARPPLAPRRPARAAFRLAALAALVALAPGCDGGADDVGADTLTARLAGTAGFESFATVVETAGLTDRLDAAGEVTVFAPSDPAFEALGDGLVGAVLDAEQRALLARLVLHHVVPGRLAPDDLADGATLTTLAGTTLRVARVGPVALVDNVALDLATAVEAGGAVAYESRGVLLTALSTRERVALSPSLGTFRGFAAQTGTLAGAGALTVLAPTDDAFVRLGNVRALLAGAPDVLRRTIGSHVLPGRVVLEALPDGAVVTTVTGEALTVRVEGERRTVGGVRVLTGQDTADGRVYVLGQVVTVALTVGDLVRIQPQASRFNADLRQQADVAARLDDPGETLTVFAPSTSAYQRRGAVISTELSLTENAALERRVPLAHVVEGRYAEADLTDGLRLTALDGTVHTVLRGLTTAPRILDLDLGLSTETFEASNGVLHVVQGFLRPAVDLFDTTLLLGLTYHTRAVRLAGLEAAYRTLVGTAFSFPNGFYQGANSLLSRPDLSAVLQYHATEQRLAPEAILAPDTTGFLTLQGLQRRVVAGHEGFAHRVLLDGEPGYVLDSLSADSAFVGQVGFFRAQAYDGSGYIYEMEAVCEISTAPRAQCPPPLQPLGPRPRPAARRGVR